MSESKYTIPTDATITFTSSMSSKELNLRLAALMAEAIKVFKYQNKDEWALIKKAFSRDGAPKGNASGNDKPAYEALREKTMDNFKELIAPYILFADSVTSGTRTALHTHFQNMLVSKKLVHAIIQDSPDLESALTQSVGNACITPAPDFNSVMIAAKDAAGHPSNRSEQQHTSLQEALEEAGFSAAFAKDVTAYMRKEHPYAYCIDKQMRSFVQALDTAIPNKKQLPLVKDIVALSTGKTSTIGALIESLEKNALTPFIRYAQMGVYPFDKDPNSASNKVEAADGLVHAQKYAQKLGITLDVKPKLTRSLTQAHLARASDVATPSGSSSPQLNLPPRQGKHKGQLERTTSEYKGRHTIGEQPAPALVVNNKTTHMGFESLMTKLIANSFRNYIHIHKDSADLFSEKKRTPANLNAASAAIVQDIMANLQFTGHLSHPDLSAHLSAFIQKTLTAQVPRLFDVYDTKTKEFQQIGTLPTPSGIAKPLASPTPLLVSLAMQVRFLEGSTKGKPDDIERMQDGVTDKLEEKLIDKGYSDAFPAEVSKTFLAALLKDYPYAFPLEHADHVVDVFMKHLPDNVEKESAESIVKTVMAQTEVASALAARNQANIDMLARYTSSTMGAERCGLTPEQQTAIQALATPSSKNHSRESSSSSTEPEYTPLPRTLSRRNIKPEDIKKQQQDNGHGGIKPTDIRAQQDNGSPGGKSH